MRLPWRLMMRRSRLRLLLTATCLAATAGPALAQAPLAQVPLALRGTGDGDATFPLTPSPVTPPSNGTGLSPTFIAPPPNPGSPVPGRRSYGRPAGRSARPPVYAPIRPPVRPSLIVPALGPEVQPPVVGLPEPVPPPPKLRRRLAEDDAYAPLGLRVGTINLFPVLGQSLGYDTNPNRSSFDRKGSALSQTEVELGIASDWSNHQLTGQLRGAYNAYPQNADANRPEGAGRLGLRLDVTRDTQVNIEGRYAIDTQRPDSPDFSATVRERPIIASEGASLGVTQRFGRVLASLTGTVDRFDYENATLANGTVFDQSDRNLTQLGVKGRVGYELKPGFVPFVEVLADTRDYDRPVDSAGFRRSSDGIGGRLGTTFELTRLVTGEIAAGAIRRSYDDPRLRDLTSPILDAALTWAITPLTTIKDTATALVDETTVAESPGVRTVRGTVEVAHALRRNLTLTTGLTYSTSDYDRVAISQESFGALVRADYKLNRWLGIRASYNFERYRTEGAASACDCTLSKSGYTAHVFLLGMRFTP